MMRNITDDYITKRLAELSEPYAERRTPSAEKFELETVQHIRDVRLVGYSFLPYITRSLDHHDLDKLDFAEIHNLEGDELALWKTIGFQQHRGNEPGCLKPMGYMCSKHHKENVTCIVEVYEMVIDWIMASFRRGLMKKSNFDPNEVSEFISKFASQCAKAMRELNWEQILANSYNMALEFIPNFQSIVAQTGYKTLESEFDRLM